MDYLIAIILPPLAVILQGKPFQFFINIILTVCFVVPGMLHALFLVHSKRAAAENKAIVDAINNNTIATMAKN